MTKYVQNWKRSKPIIPFIKPARHVEIDWKLLKKLLMHRTYSLDEKSQELFCDFLVEYIHSLGDILVEKDEMGNLYITKGTSDIYPCVVAHQDINQDEDVNNPLIIQTGKLMFGIDKDNGRQCGLGFDDKTGLYFGLHCLKTMDVVKCFFSTNEEIGCVGTKNCFMDFFDDCSFLIQLDRNSYSNDVSYSTNGVDVTSFDFEYEADKILNKYGYSFAACVYTDVGELVRQGCPVCAVNVS